MMSEPHIYTIGHSNHSLDLFMGLLLKHNIEVMADVRTSPFSQYNPQFNKGNLAGSLRREGIFYIFLGKELGARVDDPTYYIDGVVQYSRLAERQEFKDALDRLIQESLERRITLMCAEKEPLDCHRTILVSQALSNLGHEVMHIHADGSLESHSEILKRLMQVTGFHEQDMFSSEIELMQSAIAKQESKIAYRLNHNHLYEETL